MEVYIKDFDTWNNYAKTLEEKGVIGHGEGAKPREILERIERDDAGNNIL